MKSIAKKFIPKFVLQARRKLLNAKLHREFKDLTPKEVFERIYLNGMWGKSNDPQDPFYSGSGSHAPYIVTTYIDAVERFLSAFDRKLDAVDLGCGDFSIGAKLRRFCNKYIACDVVEPLIRRNEERYKDLNVDFRILDITADKLPEGDVVFIRQVLQHLSNNQIAAIIPKIQSRYQYLVLMEHLPLSKDFIANLDKPVGPHIRLELGVIGSGVILTEPPFNLQVKNSEILCEVEEYGGLLRTNLYTLQ
jgi:SAM-dependent methyltransferase